MRTVTHSHQRKENLDVYFIQEQDILCEQPVARGHMYDIELINDHVVRIVYYALYYVCLCLRRV
jgi:hypothetical protein